MGDRARCWWRMVAVAVALLVTVAVGYRVLAPAEVLTPARTAYPAAAASPQPEVIGTLTAAPLIVDGRLRVYAGTHQVRADRSIDTRTVRTPYWAYRRWPAELHGVVTRGTTVVSRWSDGELVALDGRTGRIAWRATGPKPGRGYDGRRTGAATLYTPVGLHIGRTRDAGTGVVVAGEGDLRAFDLATGREMWRAVPAPSCRRVGFTTTAGFFVIACGSPLAIEFRDLATGAVTRWRPDPAGATDIEPVGCAIGRSACPAMRTTNGDSRGWLLDGEKPVPVPALDQAAAQLVGDTAVQITSDQVVARPVRGGAESWRRDVPPDTRLLAVQPGRVHLLTPEQKLITLNPDSGAERSRFPLEYGRDSLNWETGLVHAGHGFLAVERLARPVDPQADDARYYATIQPVIFAGT